MNRTDFIDAAIRDINICKFLATKIPADKHDWRPTPGQRSVTELLQYLSRCGIGAALALMVGDWSAADPHKADAAKVTVETFGAAMDRQADQIRELITGISQADWDNKQLELPWKETVSVPRMLIEVQIKFLTAYRMQLFLYLKQMGVEGLGTVQVWGGSDPAPAG